MTLFQTKYATLAEGGDGTLDPDEAYVARTAIATARLMYPNRLIVQRNALSTCISLPTGDEFSFWNLLWISQPDVAGQMLYFCFNDPDYTVNCGVPIDPALALMAAVDRGILYGMNYIGVYQTDARNLPTAITYAHNLLKPLVTAAPRSPGIPRPQHFRRCFHRFE